MTIITVFVFVQQTDMDGRKWTSILGIGYIDLQIEDDPALQKKMAENSFTLAPWQVRGLLPDRA
jgi:hypothetical protein